LVGFKVRAYVGHVHRARVFVVVLALFAALFGACGGEDGPPVEAASLRVTTKEMRFAPSKLTALHGRTSITVHNSGSLAHTFSLNDLGREVTVNPGQTKTINVNAQPGTYPYVCRILDHEGLGMHGTLTVS
jgi:plastocyanin